MSGKPRHRPVFHEKDLETSRAHVAKRKTPQAVARRARLALALAENSERCSKSLAAEIRVCPRTVSRWRRRWCTEGFSLDEKPRTGRPPVFSPQGRGAREAPGL